YIRFEFPRSPLVPGPYLGWNIIEYPEATFASISCYSPVEPTIVDKNQNIGLILLNIIFTPADIATDLSQVGQKFGHAHKGHLAVVHRKIHTRLLHVFSSKTTEITLRIPLP